VKIEEGPKGRLEKSDRAYKMLVSLTEVREAYGGQNIYEKM
jgi:hypothetical protein